MGINSTEVSYGLGQLGSVFSDTTTTAMKPPAGKVFVAIHCLENTNFASSGGLVADNDSNLEWAGSVFARDADGTANDDAHDEAAPTATLGSGGTEIDASNNIPAGTIIYGRYTQVKTSSNVMIIAYIGE
tara:strand:- start:1105 stop:1494 length:390 start_codon:yes stop_codon:yes gene_type:complete